MMFGFFTLLFLCANGIISRLFPAVGGYWLLFILGLFIICFVLKVKSRGWGGWFPPAPFYIQLALFYLFMILMISGFHYIALNLLHDKDPINVVGLTASEALRRERAFSVLYILFPVMLLSMMYLLWRIPLVKVLRLILFPVTLSSLVAVYQFSVDGSFIHDALWSFRFEGLATDPNAMALDIFLVFPLLLAGTVMERKSGIRFLYFMIALLLLFVLAHTGSRTGIIGMTLFLFFLPTCIALALGKLNLGLRVAIGLFPVAAIAILILLLPGVQTFLGDMGYSGYRMLNSLNRIETEGLSGWLAGEQRIKYLHTGVNLVVEAPLGGWGPAGFYRESNNMFYRSGGWKENWVGDFRDSAVNHYLMIAGDFGLPILLLNVMMIMIPIGLGIRYFRGSQDDGKKLITAFLLLANILFLLLIALVPPSYFLDVMWLWSIHLVLLVVLAKMNGRVEKVAVVKKGDRHIAWAAVIIVICGMIGGYRTSFGGNYGYASRLSSPWWNTHHPMSKVEDRAPRLG